MMNLNIETAGGNHYFQILEFQGEKLYRRQSYYYKLFRCVPAFVFESEEEFLKELNKYKAKEI